VDRQVPEPRTRYGSGAGTADPAVAAGAGAPVLVAVRARYEGVIPARLDKVALLRRKLLGWLHHLPLDSDSRHDIVLAAYEAMGNAALHAYPGRRGRIRLYAKWAGDTVTVVVTDWGCGIPAQLDRVAGPPRADHRGLLLIDRIAHRMALDTGDHGTRVTMLWQHAALRQDAAR
jgi:anti-sigma regulatory factor (Ser/Thr protein kinase)